MRVLSLFSAALFLAAGLFSAPAHAVDAHAESSTCTDNLPITHFDVGGAVDSDDCFLCIHSPGSLFSGAAPVPSFLPTSFRVEASPRAAALWFFLDRLPLTRAPPPNAA